MADGSANAQEVDHDFGTLAGPEVVVVLTHKGERFYLPTDRFVALKTGSATKTSISTGFRA